MTKNNPKSVFFYLLSLVALIFTALAVGNALFWLIEKFIPDQTVSYMVDVYSQLRFAIAALLIAGPVYFFSQIQILKMLKKGEMDNDSGPRRWLTYLILLVAALVMIGSLIGVLSGYLDGDLTWRFTWKMVVVLIEAGLVFLYYFWDLRQVSWPYFRKFWLVLSLVIMIASLVLSFIYLESPSTARQRKQDDLTISHLNQLNYSVQDYYRLNKKLPGSISDLDQSRVGEIGNLTYKVVTKDKYQLCAKFNLATIKTQYVDMTWTHDAGDKCFDQVVDQLVKPVPID